MRLRTNMHKSRYHFFDFFVINKIYTDFNFYILQLLSFKTTIKRLWFFQTSKIECHHSVPHQSWMPWDDFLIQVFWWMCLQMFVSNNDSVEWLGADQCACLLENFHPTWRMDVLCGVVPIDRRSMMPQFELLNFKFLKII